MKGLFTSLQQTHPPSRPACQMHVSACLLIFGSVCRTFRKAHGRYCSQKLMPRRGTLIPLRGAGFPFTDRGSKTPRGANTLYLNSLSTDTSRLTAFPPLTATAHWRSGLHWTATMDQSLPATDTHFLFDAQTPA